MLSNIFVLFSVWQPLAALLKPIGLNLRQYLRLALNINSTKAGSI